MRDPGRLTPGSDTGRTACGRVDRSCDEGAAGEATRHALRESARRATRAGERDLVQGSPLLAEFDFVSIECQRPATNVSRGPGENLPECFSLPADEAAVLSLAKKLRGQ